jgi:hypothetical protein
MRFDTRLSAAAVSATIFCLHALPVSGRPDRDGPPAQSHDFGTVTQGVKVVHAFTVRNDGPAPLTIERVELSGASMTARFAPVIPPGQEGRIKIEWDTSQLGGEVQAEGTVRFAEPTRSPLTLVLKGTVRPTIEFIPYPAVFASVFTGETADGRVRIVNHEERPLAITRLTAGRFFTAALDTLEAGKLYEVRVHVLPGAPPGRHEEILYLETDHPTRPRIPIAVNVLVKTEVYVNPEAVDFGRVSLSELARAPSLTELLTQTVLVKKRQGEIEIKAIRSDLDFLQITRSPEGKSGSFRIDVGVDKERLRPGPITGSIHVTTNDAITRELLIPVRGEVQ